MKPVVVFACSGAAGNLAAIPRLAAEFNADVVALTLDVGQGGELQSVRQAALATGAVRAHVLDARDEFAHDCVAASLGETPGAYTPGHSVICALVARKLIEVARIEVARVIAHGGDEEDHAQIEAAARLFDPSIRVVAAHGAHQRATHAARATLWEQPTNVASASVPRAEPDAPARLEIAFEAGLPVSVNGVPMSLPELIESVSTIAGTHGVGRVTDISGTAVNAPAAVILQAAHDALGADAAHASGATVCLELFKGQHRVLSAQHS